MLEMQNTTGKGCKKGRIESKQVVLSLVTTALVIALDQLSKAWVRVNLAPGESLLKAGFLRLTYVTNTGFVFGLPANQIFLLIFTTVVILLIIPLFFYYLSVHYRSPITSLCSICLGLILGGAVGNLVDRLHFGYVTDFIDIRLWNDFHWPAFNCADASIVVGTFMLAYALFRSGLFKKIYEHNRESKN